MRVAELMLRDVTRVSAEDSVQSAAQAMAHLDSRFILVGAVDRAVGILTVRDIVVWLVAAGLDPGATAVPRVMSSSLFTCSEEEAAADVADRMSEHRIEQMPVLNAANRVVGVITRRAAAESLPIADTVQ
jgi:CBS domain-containing protein